MTDTFDVASAAAHDLVCRLAVEGNDVGVIADALVAEAMALFSVHHGMPATARGLLAQWAELREVADRGN